MNHEQLIALLIKYIYYALAVIGSIAALYKMIIRGIEKRFADQHEKIKLEIVNTYNGSVKTILSRLDYVQEDSANLTNLIAVMAAQQKIADENIARLEATTQAMHQICERNHQWDGITERRSPDGNNKR